MKRLLTTVLAAGALMLAAVPAADASVPCSAFRYEINNSGYAVELDHFRADGMNCASVRYVSRFLGRKSAASTAGPAWVARIGTAGCPGAVTHAAAVAGSATRAPPAPRSRSAGRCTPDGHRPRQAGARPARQREISVNQPMNEEQESN